MQIKLSGPAAGDADSSTGCRYAEPGSSSAAAYPNAYSLDTVGQLYMLAVHPMVSSISASTGSLAGGQLLTLTGIFLHTQHNLQREL